MSFVWSALTVATGAAVFAKLPIADAIWFVPMLTAQPAVEPPENAPVRSSTELSRGPNASDHVQHLSTEDVALFLARGDALVSRIDVSYGRLFYERAVAAGNAQAALRLLGAVEVIAHGS